MADRQIQIVHVSIMDMLSKHREIGVDSVSQWGYWSACGIACAISLAHAYGRGQGVLVQDWVDRLDPEHNGIPPEQLGEMLREIGLSPVFGADARAPFVEAIDYGMLPDQNKHQWFQGRSFAHWVIREDGGCYTDPLIPPLNVARFCVGDGVLDAACTYLGRNAFHMRVGVAH